MEGSIRLHPEFGLNPAVSKCYFCGEDSGLVLAGAACKGEAPRNMVWDMNPCLTCEAQMKAGIMLICIDQGEGDKMDEAKREHDRYRDSTRKISKSRPFMPNPSRSGKMVVLKQEAWERMPIDQHLIDYAIKARWLFIEEDGWARLGLNAAMCQHRNTQREGAD